jgi:hypothetical protein
MTIDQLLVETAREIGFPEETLKAASRHAASCAGAGPRTERALNRDLTEEEITLWRGYMLIVLHKAIKDPKFREEFMKMGRPIQSDN